MREVLSDSGVRVVTADVAVGADVRLDVTDEAAVDSLRRELGRVDILVNSAGVVGPSAHSSTWTSTRGAGRSASTSTGSFLMCRAFVPAMVDARWGRVVNLASIAAKDGNPTQSAYSASKAAVIALTKSLGKEIARTGVLANVVAPAAVESPMNARTDPAILARSQSLTPMGRMGRPDEIAELVGWLCSDAVSFSTGAVYDASGGRASY
ncbi:SDR family oxidoreductase [Rhodococcus hoagii]|nr:SDR family oxidoreductase [Prescottella equi]